MQFTIKQKVFSFKDRFSVTDISGNTIYQVEGKLLSIGHKLTLSNMHGAEIAHITQKVLSLLPKYFITLQDGTECELKKHFTFLKSSYTLITDNGEWTIKGDFTDHEYVMSCNGQTIATVSQKWFSWGDTYLLDVVDDDKAITALCIMIAIDCINSDEMTAMSNSN